MSWFCKTCTDKGIVDKVFLCADENGLVFDCAENEVTMDICEHCGSGYFDAYGNKIQIGRNDELYNTNFDD